MLEFQNDQSRGGALINLQPEELRGRYEILRVVNRGGMGEIALGRVRGAKGFEKLVVLKRLRADAEREDHAAMFDVEQELMSRIEHPNIVKVFDQPVIDNVPYLAMEYVRGRNLDQIIRQAHDGKEQFSLVFSLTIISEVLRGLAFVHRLKDNEGKALGVVHQDITPSNIMVSFFGEVKITDFGISYVTSRDGGLRRGVLKGKPRYVAPEVLAGKRVNNRADIYGVGVVLYELLTQQPLFARPTVKETLAAVARGELPNFQAELPQYSEGLHRIFARCLAKDPADRYRTSEEMGADTVAELAKLGGPLSPARLGYIVRQHFRNDPDVPEIDPSFEAALSAEAQPVLPSSFRAPDLSQTLSELDRLLGPRQSTDLFTLPPDLKSELAGIEDMDPFLALTPIPDFVWGAPNEAELLRRAHEEFGPEGPGFAAGLGGPRELPAQRFGAETGEPKGRDPDINILPPFETGPGLKVPPFPSPHGGKLQSIPPLLGSSPARPKSEAQNGSKTAEAPPRADFEKPHPTERPSPAFRAVGAPTVESASPPPLSASPAPPVPALRGRSIEREAHGTPPGGLAQKPRPEPVTEDAPSRVRGPASVEEARENRELRAPSESIAPIDSAAISDPGARLQFWLGLILGLGIGLGLGAWLFS